MDYKNLFEKFNEGGKLLLPDATVTFDAIPWSKHPASPGVELKHIITSERTDGEFSYHLVRIAPNKKIGNHIHENQLETHEVISGTGVCVNDGVELPYEAGIISIFPVGVPHEVIAGDDGLCLFAKFMPALC
ncbi:cupin domain-containing protein [Parablautia muri]|uniref:Cupin domain-containing protein n=1 Tax=Parablautia muri TaxID=2320879 RepID=A0A9X5BCX7_9FIRM|nr:cupin domain-containing protein [Parablautia muri]NBJ91387.1 cupin domain-containing protein [Parablautia muri]